MNTRDYYIEFLEELDKRLYSFVSDLESRDATLLMLGNHSIKIPLFHYLYCKLMMWKGNYNQCRINGMNVDESMCDIQKHLDTFQTFPNKITDIAEIELHKHYWYEMLSDYKNQLIVYVYNKRLLQYLIPLIKKIDQPVLLLSEYELPDETDFPESVTALTICFSEEKMFSNPFIEKYFPRFFHYANTFSILLRILQPKGIISIEGCHNQERLLAVFAKANDVPSIVIQQGWPSILHSVFRRFPYNHYLTWGEGYHKYLEKYNPTTEFIPVGYMYKVKDTDCKDKKNSVSFFLQGPFILSDRFYYNDLLDLITTVSQQLPEISFCVREHPEFKLSPQILQQWNSIPNIEIVSDLELEEVFSRTMITVSHFSSTLMEGVVHGAIPLVYDPTTDSSYCPDIEIEQIGMISKTQEEFCEKLIYILKHRETFSQQIAQRKAKWFLATGDETLDNMVNCINKITAYIPKQ